MLAPPEADVCIAGGGPAGMMAGLLFARAGLRTVVLEKHTDFLRDFRGDTVHPSTLELFHELGLLEDLLARPHNKVCELAVRIAGRRLQVSDFSRLPTRCRFIALMPQWDFLDFVAGAAAAYPGFELRMGAEVTGVLRTAQGRVAGVEVQGEAGRSEVRARLVIAADGRRSCLRDAVALPRTVLGAPIDVFWFRIPKPPGDQNTTGGVFESGRIVVLIDRGDYWQCASVLPKGAAEQTRSRGLATFKDELIAAAPELAEGLETLRSWDQVKLLAVAVDRLDRWHTPGLLAIGDAAHAMSPIGGVGINLAIADAVAAANILAAPLARGADPDPLLAAVQRRRGWPTRVTQALQVTAQERILGRLLSRQTPLERPPWPLRLIARSRLLQQLPARLVGLGIRREHIRSPAADPPAE